jgi:sporulation protein YlmC with PRC-barrel domain
MRHVFSIRALLNATVLSVEGIAIARIHDLVWNQPQAKVTHLLLSPIDQADLTTPQLYAIHHSFFFTAEDDNSLAYIPKIGKDESIYFIQLPARYQGLEPDDVAAFNRYVRKHTHRADHRSDNE